LNIPIRVPKAFRVIAHRGSSAYAPENTLPAFRLARKMGVAEVELDVQLTTDGVVVLCHDLVLTRYGHGDVVVEEMASDELLALDMGSWFSPHLFAATPMLSLSQLLKMYGDDFIFHIELKGLAEELAAATCAVVETHRTHKQTIFTSFSYQQLERMRNVSPDSRLGWLVQTIDEEVLDRARGLELFQLCPRAGAVNIEEVARGRTAAPEIRVWGIAGTPQEVRAMVLQTVESGCDGMTINWPDWVKR
jgi:glycerophosphoryl diester phosphodiesterase